MTLLEALLRGALVAVVARWLAPSLAAALATSGPWRVVVAAALAAPPLAIAAGLAGLPPGGVVMDELRYLLVLVVRLAPLGALLWLAVPVTERAARWHLVGSEAAPLRLRVQCAWRGGGRRTAAVMALPGFLAATEFELASIWTRETWAVHLFDAQVGGTTAWEGCRQAMPMLLLALLVLVPVIGALPAAQASRPEPGSTWPRRCWLALALPVLVLVPAWRLAGQAIWTGGFPLGEELGTSLMLAGAATVTAVVVAALWWSLRVRLRVILGPALIAPGLVGSTVLGLTVLSLLAPWPGLSGSLVPWWLALVLLCLPLALPAWALLQRQGSAGSWQAAVTTGTRRGRLAWLLHGRAVLALAVGLVLWCLQDLPASALLAPAGQTPAQVRILNFLHYGHDGAVAAWLLVLWATAWGVLGVAILAAGRPHGSVR